MPSFHEMQYMHKLKVMEDAKVICEYLLESY